MLRNRKIFYYYSNGQVIDIVDGDEVYELSGKLTNATWSKTWDKMKPIGDNSGELLFEAA